MSPPPDDGFDPSIRFQSGDLKAMALALGLAALMLALFGLLHFASTLKGRPMLKGKKTYIVAIGVVLTAIGGFMHGDLTVLDAVTTALTGLGLASLRSGIANP